MDPAAVAFYAPRVPPALLPLLLAALPPSLAEAGRAAWPEAPARSERLVAYELDVSLDPEARTLRGTVEVAWRNPSDAPVDVLWLHLYLNAFESRATTFHAEAGEAHRTPFPPLGPDDWGFADVTDVRFEGAPIGLPRCERPDVEHPATARDLADCTVASLALPRAVGPGETARLALAFEARLPRVIARTGCFADFCLAAHFFPKLAVLEPAGRRGATAPRWSVHQHHAATEFYADFGTWLVRVELPEGYEAGATGVLVDEAREGGKVRRTWVARDVHDFAFVAGRGLVETKDRFEDLALPPVELRLLSPPERAHLAPRYLAAAKAALAGFGRRLVPYPFPALTLVDPPWNAGEAGGMEYPTFVTLGAPRTAGPGELPLEVLTVHEVGHQWFQGLLASNEPEEAWLDEGFTTHVTGLVIDRDLDLEGRYVVRLARLPLFEVPIPYRYPHAIRAALRDPPLDPLAQDAWRFRDLISFGLASYPRTDLTLRTLEGLVGAETWAAVLRTYAGRFAFRHPGAADFRAVAEEVSGRDLGPFFEAFVEGTEVLDYAVASLEVEEERTREGLHREADGSRRLVDEAAAEAEAELARRRGVAPRFRSTIELRRTGAPGLPVTLRLVHDDGRVEEETWDGATRWKRLERVGTTKIVRAEVDPEKRLALDRDRGNDAKVLEPGRLAAARWTALSGELLALGLAALGGAW